jgi:hypothetical protein
MDAAGGPTLNLCQVEVARGGSWNQDGVILFTPYVNGGIYQVPATGGTPVPVTKIDPSGKDTTHRWPYFLSDGKHFLYFAASHTDISHASDAVHEASLDGKENKLLLHVHSNAAYANGYLLYVRESTLMAQPFDLRRRELTGEAHSVAENVETDTGWWSASSRCRKTASLHSLRTAPTPRISCCGLITVGSRSVLWANPEITKPCACLPTDSG